jgi:hypothetical protein
LLAHKSGVPELSEGLITQHGLLFVRAAAVCFAAAVVGGIMAGTAAAAAVAVFFRPGFSNAAKALKQRLQLPRLPGPAQNNMLHLHV